MFWMLFPFLCTSQFFCWLTIPRISQETIVSACDVFIRIILATKHNFQTLIYFLICCGLWCRDCFVLLLPLFSYIGWKTLSIKQNCVEKCSVLGKGGRNALFLFCSFWSCVSRPFFWHHEKVSSKGIRIDFCSVKRSWQRQRLIPCYRWSAVAVGRTLQNRIIL